MVALKYKKVLYFLYDGKVGSTRRTSKVTLPPPFSRLHVIRTYDQPKSTRVRSIDATTRSNESDDDSKLTLFFRTRGIHQHVYQVLIVFCLVLTTCAREKDECFKVSFIPPFRCASVGSSSFQHCLCSEKFMPVDFYKEIRLSIVHVGSG
jgi:hypothetical protein